MSRPQPGPTEPGDVVAVLIWIVLQALALWWLVSMALGFQWISWDWFSFSRWAGL